jgi:hypothetical protein
MLPFTFQVKISKKYALVYCTLKYKSNIFLLIFTWKVKGNIFGYLYTNQTYILFFHMKLQNFEFKNYLNHYLKRSDHFHGTLKFLHTVSVSSSDSLVIGFRCMLYKWDQLLNLLFSLPLTLLYINYFLTLIKHYFCSQFYNYM